MIPILFCNSSQCLLMETTIQAAEARNWLELPSDVISTILLKLGPAEILTRAQNVCTLWRKICKDPLMWRVIDTYYFYRSIEINHDLKLMCKQAVDRSCGQLVDINIVSFVTDDLLHYISQSSNQLKRLRMSDCYSISDEGLSNAVSKFPLLEHLEIVLNYSSYVETFKTVGRCCPLLKSLNLDLLCRGRDERDKEARVIAEAMPNLLHLQLSGNGLTNSGLLAILDGCPVLESLDLQNCYNLKLGEELEKRCAERIKILHLPHNFTESDCSYGDSDYEESFYSDFDYEDYSDDFKYDYNDDTRWLY